jgi:hypothetical protein
MPIRFDDNFVTVGPSPRAMMRRPVRVEMRFKRHHS